MEAQYFSKNFIINIMRKMRHTQLVLGGGRILAQAFCFQSKYKYGTSVLWNTAGKKNEADFCVQTFLCLRDISRENMAYGIRPYMWGKDIYVYTNTYV